MKPEDLQKFCREAPERQAAAIRRWMNDPTVRQWVHQCIQDAREHRAKAAPPRLAEEAKDE